MENRMNTPKAEPILRRNLIILSRYYCKARHIKLTTLALLANADGRFFEELGKRHTKTGRRASFTVRKYDLLIAWFIKNWPRDTDMPDLIGVAFRPACLRSPSSRRLARQLSPRPRPGQAHRS